MRDGKLLIMIIIFLMIAVAESIIIIHIMQNNGKEKKENNNTEMDVRLKEVLDGDYNHDLLKSVVYTYSIPSTGYLDEIKFEIITNSIKGYNITCDGNGSKTLIKEYLVDQTDYSGLLKYIHKYKFAEWDKLKEIRDEELLDGPSITITFTYNDEKFGKSDNEIYVLDLQNSYTMQGNDILKDFKEFLYSLIREKYFVKEYEQE